VAVMCAPERLHPRFEAWLPGNLLLFSKFFRDELGGFVWAFRRRV